MTQKPLSTSVRSVMAEMPRPHNSERTDSELGKEVYRPALAEIDLGHGEPGMALKWIQEKEWEVELALNSPTIELDPVTLDMMINGVG